MLAQKIEKSALHETPDDMLLLLQTNSTLLDKWNALTPLARNEWICWVTIVKQKATREQHLIRMEQDLLSGTKRPCCWPGCPHRRESAKKWFKHYD